MKAESEGRGRGESREWREGGVRVRVARANMRVSVRDVVRVISILGGCVAMRGK